MKKIIFAILLFAFFFHGCENPVKTNPYPFFKIYYPEKIKKISAKFDGMTGKSNLYVTFQPSTRFSGVITVKENDKDEKILFGHGTYEFGENALLEFEYTTSDNFGKLHYKVTDWIYGQIDSNTVGVVDSLLLAEAIIEFKN